MGKGRERCRDDVRETKWGREGEVQTRAEWGQTQRTLKAIWFTNKTTSRSYLQSSPWQVRHSVTSGAGLQCCITMCHQGAVSPLGNSTVTLTTISNSKPKEINFTIFTNAYSFNGWTYIPFSVQCQCARLGYALLSKPQCALQHISTFACPACRDRL